MTLQCIGPAKSGTHALLKAVQLLGVSDSQQTHEFEYTDKAIVITRNPRNVLISWVRFNYGEMAQGFVIGAMARYYNQGPFCDEYREYQTLSDKFDIHSVRYEDLIKDDKAIRDIAEYLEVPYLDDAFNFLPGMTVTWTGSPSNWRDHWTDAIDKAWRDCGGYELESEFGYGTVNQS